MNWQQRASQKELLDGDGIPFADLARNLRELNTINTLLGGHRITQKGVEKLLPASFSGVLHVAEVGCGGGDNLRAAGALLQKKNIPHRLTGIDLKPECIAYARAHSGIAPDKVQWLCSSYESVVFPPADRPHILFSALFCHHFSDAALAGQLQWLAQNSRLGFFINDLHRHPVAYHSIRLLTRFFSKSDLVRADAPLSVLRGFRRREWEAIFHAAGLSQPEIDWKWAFRHLIIHRCL